MALGGVAPASTLAAEGQLPSDVTEARPVADFLDPRAAADAALAVAPAAIAGARAKQIPIDVTAAEDTTSSCFTKGYAGLQMRGSKF